MLYQLLAHSNTYGLGVEFELKLQGTGIFPLTVKSWVGRAYTCMCMYIYIYAYTYAQDYVSFRMSWTRWLSVSSRPWS